MLVHKHEINTSKRINKHLEVEKTPRSQKNTSRQQKTPSIQINTPTRKKHLEVFFSLRGKINTSKRNKHLKPKQTPRSEQNTSRRKKRLELPNKRPDTKQTPRPDGGVFFASRRNKHLEAKQTPGSSRNKHLEALEVFCLLRVQNQLEMYACMGYWCNCLLYTSPSPRD